jgi:hypothetical protein
MAGQGGVDRLMVQSHPASESVPSVHGLWQIRLPLSGSANDTIATPCCAVVSPKPRLSHSL